MVKPTCVRADAERQRQDGGGGKSGSLRDQAEGEAQVAKHEG